MKDLGAPATRLSARAGVGHLPVVGDLVATWRLLRDRREPRWAKAVALGALAYLVLPVDLIPEAVVPVIGWLDDLGVLLVARFVLAARLDRHRGGAAAEQASGGPQELGRPGGSASPARS